MLIFVYGTLKKGFINHRVIKEASFKETVTTSDKFVISVDGTYGFPYLLEYNNKGKYIQGEIYEIDESLECELDYFEGVPDLYVKKDINISGYDNVTAYFSNSEKEEAIIEYSYSKIMELEEEIYNFK